MSSKIKTRQLTVTIWASRQKPGGLITIKMASRHPEFITTFRDDPNSVRRHDHAFGKLKQVLKDSELWDFE